MTTLKSLSEAYVMKFRSRRASAPAPQIEDIFLAAGEAFRDGYRVGQSVTKAGMVYEDEPGMDCRICGEVCELGPTGICLKCDSQNGGRR